ncbi:hypothetical protein QYF36_008988 [Acer negundo]|nr:hypothetical protein QYF36_008988 [Acer negundo]
MGVVLELPEGGMRAHTKGALEIVLAACDKFPSEALRTQCLAYIDLEDKFSPDDSIPVSNPREKRHQKDNHAYIASVFLVQQVILQKSYCFPPPGNIYETAGKHGSCYYFVSLYIDIYVYSSKKPNLWISTSIVNES